MPFRTGCRLVVQGGRPCLRTRPSFICRVCFESACWRANKKTALRRRVRPSGAAPGSGDDVCQPASSCNFFGPSARTRPLEPRRQLFLDRMGAGTQKSANSLPRVASVAMHVVSEKTYGARPPFSQLFHRSRAKSCWESKQRITSHLMSSAL